MEEWLYKTFKEDRTRIRGMLAVEILQQTMEELRTEQAILIKDKEEESSATTVEDLVTLQEIALSPSDLRMLTTLKMSCC